MNNKTLALMGLLMIGLLAAPGVSASSGSDETVQGCLQTYIADAKAAGSYNEHEAALTNFTACLNFIGP